MLWTIAIILAVVIAAILIFAATKPDVFRVQRSRHHRRAGRKDLSASQRLPALAVLVPYEKKDPAMKRTFSGPATGLARSMPGTATRTSAPAAWRSPRFRRTRGSRSSSSCSSRSRRATRLSSPSTRRAAPPCRLGDDGPAPYHLQGHEVFFNMDRMVGSDFEKASPTSRPAPRSRRRKQGETR